MGRASPTVQSSSPSKNAMEAGGPTERTTLGLKENQCLWPWGGGGRGTLIHQCLELGVGPMVPGVQWSWGQAALPGP